MAMASRTKRSLFCFNDFIPKYIEDTLVKNVVGISIQIKKTNSHQMAPPSLSEFPPPEPIKQKRKPIFNHNMKNIYLHFLSGK